MRVSALFISIFSVRLVTAFGGPIRIPPNANASALEAAFKAKCFDLIQVNKPLPADDKGPAPTPFYAWTVFDDEPDLPLAYCATVWEPRCDTDPGFDELTLGAALLADLDIVYGGGTSGYVRNPVGPFGSLVSPLPASVNFRRITVTYKPVYIHATWVNANTTSVHIWLNQDEGRRAAQIGTLTPDPHHPGADITGTFRIPRALCNRYLDLVIVEELDEQIGNYDTTNPAYNRTAAAWQPQHIVYRAASSPITTRC